MVLKSWRLTMVQVCGSKGHTAGFINGGSVYLDCKSWFDRMRKSYLGFARARFDATLMWHVRNAGPNKPCYL